MTQYRPLTCVPSGHCVKELSLRLRGALSRLASGADGTRSSGLCSWLLNGVLSTRAGSAQGWLFCMRDGGGVDPAWPPLKLPFGSRTQTDPPTYCPFGQMVQTEPSTHCPLGQTVRAWAEQTATMAKAYRRCFMLADAIVAMSPVKGS